MARSIIRQIGLALKYLHAHRIIHRDIKLENVLLSNSNSISSFRAKLADFGLAETILESETNSADAHKSGTTGYLAPEILEG